MSLSPQKRKELIWCIVTYGTTGDYQTDLNDIHGYMKLIIPNIDHSIARYNNSVKNGSKGGKPDSLDHLRIYDLKQEGYTNRQIATMLDCHINSVGKSLKAEKGYKAYVKQQSASLTNTNINQHINQDKDIDKEIEVDSDADAEVDNDIDGNTNIEADIDIEVKKDAEAYKQNKTNSYNQNQNYKGHCFSGYEQEPVSEEDDDDDGDLPF